MGKIAGIRNKSPETYPASKGKPTVVQTLSTTNPDTAAITSAFATILLAPLTFTPEVSGVRALIQVSGVLQTPSVPNPITVGIVLDGDNTPPAYQLTFLLPNNSTSPTPFSLVFETPAPLTVSAPLTIDVQAKTAAGGETAAATDVSLVIIASTA